MAMGGNTHVASGPIRTNGASQKSSRWTPRPAWDTGWTVVCVQASCSSTIHMVPCFYITYRKRTEKSMEAESHVHSMQSSRQTFIIKGIPLCFLYFQIPLVNNVAVWAREGSAKLQSTIQRVRSDEPPDGRISVTQLLL